MSVPSPLSDLRARLDGLPFDRAPLRRAGLLALLLVVLLAAGKAFGPSQAAALAPATRHDVQAGTEEVSAPPRPSGWTGGRVLALVLLATGGLVAVVLRRRRDPAAAGADALDVIETHSLGPGHSLRLVGCGDEVLLLSVGGDGARLLRHWPRERFDRDAVSLAGPTARFADALADAGASLGGDRLATDATADATLEDWLRLSGATSPLSLEGGRDEDAPSTPPSEVTLPSGDESATEARRHDASAPAPFATSVQPQTLDEKSLRPSTETEEVRPDLGVWADPAPAGTRAVGEPAIDVPLRPQWAEETASDLTPVVRESAAPSSPRGAPEWQPVPVRDGALFPPATARGLRQFGNADA